MRPPRLIPVGIPHHVLNRAAARKRIFEDAADYVLFEQVLDEAITRFPVQLAAHCVMPNHFHLLMLPTEDGALSACLAWLQSTHAMRWHAARGTAGQGAVYQARFRSFAIETDRYLETAWRYIERTPVRAGLSQRAEDWPWGSAWNRVHAPARAARLLRNDFLPLPSDWLERINEPLACDEDERLRTCIRRGDPFGSPHWQQAHAHRLGLDRVTRPRGRPRNPDRK